MSRKLLVTVASAAVLGLSGMAASLPTQASGFGDFMNPSKWFGGRSHDRDYYYDRGYYGYPGYGYGYPGWGGYGYPGWGGYGYPGYGYGYPAQNQNNNQPPPPPPTPQ